MRTTAHSATCLVAACLLGGCASSSAVRQAKPNDPIIVVTVESTTKKPTEKPTAPKVDQDKVAKENERMVGILGVLRGSDEPTTGGLFGGSVTDALNGRSPNDILDGSGQGFGGLGLRGVGIGGGISGGGGGTIGLGSIGTIGTGSGYGGGGYGSIGGHRNTGERAKVKLGNVVVTGALTTDVAQRHIDDHRDDFQTCHQLEAAQAGNRWGSVTMRLMIDSTGHVSDVQVYETTLGSRDLESCIAHVIGAFVFPASTLGSTATVLLPISF